jgi:hypothetical protein
MHRDFTTPRKPSMIAFFGSRCSYDLRVTCNDSFLPRGWPKFGKRYYCSVSDSVLPAISSRGVGCCPLIFIVQTILFVESTQCDQYLGGRTLKNDEVLRGRHPLSGLTRKRENTVKYVQTLSRTCRSAHRSPAGLLGCWAAHADNNLF